MVLTYLSVAGQENATVSSKAVNCHDAAFLSLDSEIWINVRAQSKILNQHLILDKINTDNRRVPCVKL